MLEPTPEEFGLTQAEIDWSEKVLSWPWKTVPLIIVTALLGGFIWPFVTSTEEGFSIIDKIGFSFLAGWMVGLPIAVIVAIPSCFAAYWMCVFVLRIFSPAFRRSRKISIQRIPFEAARAAFEAYLKEKDREMRSFWMCLDGHSFENEAASLFRKLGYQAEVTTMSGDQGIDIALTGQDDELVVVQCKQHKKPVGPTTGFYRVRRGGSWYSAWTFRQSDLRSAGRAYLKYSHSNFGLGFRLARTAQ